MSLRMFLMKTLRHIRRWHLILPDIWNICTQNTWLRRQLSQKQAKSIKCCCMQDFRGLLKRWGEKWSPERQDLRMWPREVGFKYSGSPTSFDNRLGKLACTSHIQFTPWCYFQYAMNASNFSPFHYWHLDCDLLRAGMYLFAYTV